MNGIFLIDKEKEYTSRDVVNIIGRRFHTKKVGHAGTLDPFATGLLIVTFNKGTKITSYLEGCTKTYVASLKLGYDTDTLDLNGNKTEEKDVPLLTKEDIENVLKYFLGTYSQAVPKYSAVKFRGKELYKYARNNIETPELRRDIDILDIRLIGFEDNIIDFEVTCSKGTYIRQLGQDIAHKLNTCGHLISLRRTRIGNFDVDQASKVKEVKEEDLISVTKALSHMVVVRVEQSLETDIKNGKKVKLSVNEEIVFVINENEDPIAILEKVEENIYRVKRGLF